MTTDVFIPAETNIEHGETMNATAGTDSSSDGLRVALVTAYPPSQTTLNEYGYHLARHLAAKPEVGELVVMHDDFDGVEETVADLPEGARAVPAWRYGSAWNPVRIVRAVRAAKADVVLVNAHFTSFGAGKIAAALGLLTPALLRASGTPTVVLLHNLVDTVDLEAAGFSSNPVITRILSFFGGVVTRMVLAADKVCVTMPQYVDVLRDKYGAKNVYLAPHGSFEEPDPIERESGATPSLLAFGKWGTYKKVEVLLDAHAILRSEGIDVEVVVAGTDSHNAEGYLDGVKEKYRGLPGISFTGYVAEEDVPGVLARRVPPSSRTPARRARQVCCTRPVPTVVRWYCPTSATSPSACAKRDSTPSRSRPVMPRPGPRSARHARRSRGHGCHGRGQQGCGMRNSTRGRRRLACRPSSGDLRTSVIVEGRRGPAADRVGRPAEQGGPVPRGSTHREDAGR